MLRDAGCAIRGAQNVSTRTPRLKAVAHAAPCVNLQSRSALSLAARSFDLRFACRESRRGLGEQRLWQSRRSSSTANDDFLRRDGKRPARV